MEVSQYPGVRCPPFDQSATPEFNPLIRGSGICCKTIVDCTALYALKDRFRRADFVDVDSRRFLPGKTTG
jgi:hypothetical protein